MRISRQRNVSRHAGIFLTYACWITSLSQQSPATLLVSGKTDSWIIREAGISGSDDTCPERGLHDTLGLSIDTCYGKIIAKINRNLSYRCFTSPASFSNVLTDALPMSVSGIFNISNGLLATASLPSTATIPLRANSILSFSVS